LPQLYEAKLVNRDSSAGKKLSSRAMRAWSGTACQIGDVVLFAGTFVGMFALPYFHAHGTLSGFLQMREMTRNTLVTLMCLGTWHVLLVVIGVYSIRLARSIPEYTFRCLIALNCCAAVVGLIEVELRRQSSVWQTVGIFWIVSAGLFILLRALLLAFARSPKALALPIRRLIIVGNGQRAGQLYDEVRAHPEWAYSLVGFVGFELEQSFLPASMLLGGVKELEVILAGNAADEVIVAVPMVDHNEIVSHSIAVCQLAGVPCQYFTEHFGVSMDRKVSELK
jgi:FlaA1/EpsC-like NDP-sugar epimerase